tara:strand:- start:57 stop:890 length:834 start_codon:yes stop_codon:yes gene_type:complete
MQQVNFKKKVNLWELATFSKTKNFDSELLLRQAYHKKFLIDKDKLLLNKFIDHFKTKKNTNSQLYQDIFASFIIENNFDKTFLEFGATNGLDLSNSFSLETYFGWQGVLSEPSHQWHDSLQKNRNKSTIITDCIWTESGKKLEFFESQSGELSTLKDFIENDIKSMPGNTKLRMKKGRIINVKTISLNDVIKNYFNGKSPSYISIDTEGSEFEILKYFDFQKYKPIVFTIEHNFTENQTKIDSLMLSNNYERVFKEITAFDAWYIHKDIYRKLIGQK